jgi:hypothetical protein
MRPNLASPGLLEKPVSSSCGVRLLGGYVNGLGGWICRHLASPVGCGVATTATDPATSWDDPSSHPLAPPPVSLLETVVSHRSCLAAASLLETTAAHCSRLAAARLLVVPHRSLLATASLLAASLLPPECTSVAHLQAATLRARHVTANPARTRSRRPTRRTQTRTLWPGPLGWSEECRRCSRKLEEIVLLNHVS